MDYSIYSKEELIVLAQNQDDKISDLEQQLADTREELVEKMKELLKTKDELLKTQGELLGALMENKKQMQIFADVFSEDLARKCEDFLNMDKLV